jgi:hypothetical protein
MMKRISNPMTPPIKITMAIMKMSSFLWKGKLR